MTKKIANIFLALWIILTTSQVFCEEQNTNLGNGFYLFSDEINKESMVMGLTVTSTQMNKLMTRRDFSPELQTISKFVY